MILKIIISFYFLYSQSLFSDDLIEQPLENIENIFFQEDFNTIPDQFQNLLENNEDEFLNDLSLSTKNSYYNNLVINLLSDNKTIKSSLTESESFFFKIKQLENNINRFVFNKKLFSSVLFDGFINPEYNQIYLRHLHESSRFEDLCNYYKSLKPIQKDFKSNIIYSTICLLEDKNFSQLELLLEIYDTDIKKILNSDFLAPFLKNNFPIEEVKYNSLGLIDKYIVFKNPKIFLLNNFDIKNVLDIQIYINNTNEIDKEIILKSYQDQIINNFELLSIFAKFKDTKLFNEYDLYNQVASKININEKLKIINKNISNIDMRYYDFSRLINDQFIGFKMLSSNFKYPKALLLLLLSQDDIGIDNFIKASADYSFKDNKSIVFFNGLRNYLLNKNSSNVIDINNFDDLLNTSSMFFLQNNFLNISANSEISFFSDNESKYINYRKYSNLLLYTKTNSINNKYMELLNIIKNINFNNINEVDLFYINLAVEDEYTLRQLMINLISYNYLVE